MSSAARLAPNLTRLGSTANTEYFLAADDIVIVMPHAGSVDDGETARANVAFQMSYASKLGRRCGFVVMTENIRSQDAAARRVYAQGMDPAHCFGAALVAPNALSNAIASFFLGLTRPRVPTRMLTTLEAAIAWLESRRSESVT